MKRKKQSGSAPKRKPSNKRSAAAKRGWETRQEKARVLEELHDAGVEGALAQTMARRILEGRKIPSGTKRHADYWFDTFRLAGRQQIDLHEGRFYK